MLPQSKPFLFSKIKTERYQLSAFPFSLFHPAEKEKKIIKHKNKPLWKAAIRKRKNLHWKMH